MKYVMFIMMLIAIVLLFAYINFKRTVKLFLKERNQVIKSHKIFKSSYGNVEYEVRGEGKPILVSHGITGGIDQGIGISEEYIGGHYKMIFISRFGYLESDIPEDASVKKQAVVYNELLDYLNIDKVFIFGNSAGGTSSLIFAEEYPDRCKGLILQSSNLPGKVAGLPPKQVMEFVFSNDFIYWSTIKLFGTKMLGTFIREEAIEKLSKSELKDIETKILLSSLPVSDRTDGIIFDMFVSNPFINSAEFEKISITVPALVVHAADDPSIPFEYTENLIKVISNMEVVELTGGHLMLGSKKTVGLSIGEFIEEHKY